MLNGQRRFVATVMDSSAVPEINAPSCHAISKTPRAAGYRVSDFVHRPDADIARFGASRCSTVNSVTFALPTTRPLGQCQHTKGAVAVPRQTALLTWPRSGRC